LEACWLTGWKPAGQLVDNLLETRFNNWQFCQRLRQRAFLATGGLAEGFDNWSL
jgi:hypothetical protein